MWRIAPFVVLPAVILAAYFLVPFLDRGQPMPENFPVLEQQETAAASLPTVGEVELATFGSGCFWCTEAVFQQLKGVRKVESGYSGGFVKNPTYAQVCNANTGHAEVVQITFDPKIITYPELLEVFWRSHDPTTKDRQGNDSGPQYRSAIFTHSERQQQLAEKYKQQIDAAGVYRSPIVTEIVLFTEFYAATADHQNYYVNNSRQGYCRAVISPKVEKLRAVFKDKLKNDGH